MTPEEEFYYSTARGKKELAKKDKVKKNQDLDPGKEKRSWLGKKKK